MKRFFKNTISLMLALLMLIQAGEAGIAFAVEEADKAINPAEHIELTVPEKFRDGGNWFFIPKSGYTTSEKSTEKLYIPIQRTGDLDAPAEITLKVIDLSARHDVNYKVEIYKEEIDPEIIFGAEPIVDLIQNADAIEEVEIAEDENEFGEVISEYGGAEIVDGEGNTVGTVTVTPLDESGNPLVEENDDTENDVKSAAPGQVEESEWTEGETESADERVSATTALRNARNAFTGTVSDRQELEGGDPLDMMGMSTMNEDDYNEAMAEATQESYPGKEYRLTFAPGEEAKFLVITPMYSDAAEGDMQIMLMLKNPSEGFAVGEDVNPVSVNIRDEDEPEPVYIGMAADTVVAENGKAAITVTRSGRMNAIKGVTIASWDGSAKQGDDYSGIGAKLYFSMGLTTRSIELPVRHGEKEKDFYVTITALADEQITVATTHVIIPAAESAEGDGKLMNADDAEKRIGRPVTKDPINVKDGWFGGGDGSSFKNETSFYLSTHSNKEEIVGYGMNTAKYGAAYDGVYLEYDGFLDWCDAQFMLVRWTNDSEWYRAHTNYFDDGGWTYNHWLYCCWNGVQAPQKITIEEENCDNEGPIGTESFVSMYVNGVYLIKRKFNITVENAAVKPLIGVKDEDVLKDYEAVFLDGGSNSTGNYWTDDSFSVTAKTNTPLQLVGLEAQAGNDWIQFATIDAKTSSVVVELNTETINKLDGLNAIRWAKNGSLNGDSYMGSITVRPVFDYINVTVEVQEGTYGTLNMPTSAPTSEWNFGQNSDLVNYMGTASQMTYTSQKDADGNDFFAFGASGNDPRVALNNVNADADSLKWVKIRAKNLSNATDIELFAAPNGRISANSCAHITLESDSEWHEYVVNIQEANIATQKDFGKNLSSSAWTGQINWIRLDPMWIKGDDLASGGTIYIDYLAFFPDEASAQAYSGNVLTYHVGDVLDLSATVNTAGVSLDMQPSGVYYELRTQGSTGALINHDTIGFTDGHKEFKLRGESSGGKTVDRPYYMMRPVFTGDKNNLVVTVSDADYAKLDTARGIFAEGCNEGMVHENGEYRIVVARNVVVNDTYAITAYAKDGQSIPRWTTYDKKTYSGETFYLLTNPLPEENMVTLTVPSGQKLTWMTLSGTVASSTFNLNTERSANDVIAAESAWVAFGEYGAWTDEEGDFTLPAVRACNDTLIRFLVDYNGVSSIREARVPGKSSRTYASETMLGESVKAVRAKAGMVLVENFSDTGAHFESALVEQKGKLLGAVDTMAMNGNKLTVTVKVAGGQYVLNNETFNENIQDVTLFFMDQETGEIHGIYSSNTEPSKESPAKWGFTPDGNGGGTFTLEIFQFNPAHPEEWTYGDVLMAKLTTDKKTVTKFFTGEKFMRYDPVSTGYAVVADKFEPQTFDYDLDDLAEFLNVEPQTDEEGNLLDDGKRASFGAFPYIGEISAAVHVFSKVVSSSTATAEMDSLMSDLESMGGDDEEEDMDFGDDEVSGGSHGGEGGGSTVSFAVNILVKFDETFYGGVRFMLGVIVSTGGGNAYKNQKNPFHTANTMKAALGRAVETGYDVAGELISKTNKSPGAFGSRQFIGSNFGGPHFKIAVYVGFYIDFGYIELTNTKDGKVEKSHDLVFMGAGGFIGFAGAVGYTWAFAIGPVPAYVNVEAGLNVTCFLGSSADPNKTLAEYEKLDDFKNKDKVHAQDYRFNFEFKGRIYVSGSIGVGFYKILGARITVELVFEAGYSNNVTKWFPGLFDSGWGYVTECGFTGTIDLVFTSIDVYSASWPLPLADGFMYYFQEVRRANKCISYVLKGVEDEHGTAVDRAAAVEKCRELGDLVDAYTADTETLKDKTYALKKWAYDHDIITWTTANAIEMNKQGGLVGTVMNAVLQDDSGIGSGYHTNPHVNSEWVAADGQLTAAYSPVNTADIVSDAYAQPMSKIIGIGGNRFLMVFLDDTLSRDAMQAATLKWTVYDANNDSWTAPQTVQNDRTADSRPFLADAGNKVILTWASATDEKYEALKVQVAKENNVYVVDNDTGIITITDPILVEEEMEADPARVMNTFDIFTVEFDKQNETFGPITQLTDDLYYDDYPQAVYDAETGDYLILYTKTAQDDEKYSTNGDKLMDIVGVSPDPDKTYSVVMYMLYNNQTEAVDTFGQSHESGWARDYYFPNETDQSLEDQQAELAKWGGQRFLPSTLRTDDGGQADPPITDLTVASGYNGLAAYAYTVDMDFNLKTAEDRALFFQAYNFKTHSTYVPVRVAGSVNEEKESYNYNSRSWVTSTVTRQVEVGAPKLIRNGGNTFLFWREDGQTLKYLNVSEMLNVKVPKNTNPYQAGYEYSADDWTYALSADGTFATYPVPENNHDEEGNLSSTAYKEVTYEPDAMNVDFGSQLTDSAIEITDYEVITDKMDNLYVVWTDTVEYAKVNEASGEPQPATAQEIYSTALIRQQAKNITGKDENDNNIEIQSETVRWSKPYRITRNNEFNDGLALALDSQGGLIIVHNRFKKLTAQSEEEVEKLINDGKIGLTKNSDGQLYAASLTYNSPVTLSVTRCDKIGSLEATLFEFSDAKPVAGETVRVTAAIENVGLIDAEGSEVAFYEYKNGVQGSKIGETIISNEPIIVNTAKKVSFDWTVPADGPEGYSIQAVIKEKRADGGWYDDVKSYSDTFTTAPDYYLAIDEAVQDGDRFRVKYRIANRGNAPAEEGTSVSIQLVGLYDELDSERYGNLKTDILYSADVSDKLPVKTASGKEIQKSLFEDEQYVTIPASVFNYCGYDAIRLVLSDRNGDVIEESNQKLLSMDSPMNVLVNGGRTLNLNSGESAQISTDFNSTLFIKESRVLYTVANPDIATVEADGTVTGISNGSTVLTATLLPSGKTAEIRVNVGSLSDSSTPTDVSMSGDDGTIEIDAAVSDGTAAITAPTAQQMEVITDKAGETGSVTIDLSSLPAEVTAVSIPAETVKAISEAVEDNGEGLIIKLPESTVAFDPAALSEIVKQMTDSDLKLNVDPIIEIELNAKQKEGIAELDVQTIYDIYLTSNDKRITDFGNGRAVIELAHKAKPEQKVSGFTVWYVAEDGTMEKNPTSATKDSVRFVVKHFSTYVLAYSDPIECEKNENCPMSAFTDLDMTSWYHDGVHWALENEIISGYGGGKYGPDDATSRAMIVTMLHRFEGEPKVAGELAFTDVEEGTWYSEAIRWATENGIVSGYGDGKFGPNDPLTREQLATILCRYAKYKGIDTSAGELKPLNSFNDAATVSEWAVKSIRWAVDSGIINGVGNGTVSPKTSATRAQVATMLMRYAALEQ